MLILTEKEKKKDIISKIFFKKVIDDKKLSWAILFAYEMQNQCN
jgi:hypothetical protein